MRVLQLNASIEMVGGISCGHVVVVPYHEKATVAVDTCVLEVVNYAAGSELEAGTRSGDLGAVENDEREVKNEAVVHGELVVVKDGQGVENEEAVNGE